MAQIMESTSEPMRIQISGATEKLLDAKGSHRRNTFPIRRDSKGLSNFKRPKFITQLREDVGL